MNSKPRILFVYDHKDEDRWQDGLWAALNILEEDFEIYKENLEKSMPEQFPVDAVGLDFCLGWGGFNSSVDKQIQEYVHKYEDTKTGLCIGGNAFLPTGADNYDVLFYETKWYRPQINFHKNIVHAFGINSEIYNKDPLPAINGMQFATPVVWDYLGVGAFANWKRWEKMIDKKGMKLVVGEYQEGNEQESGDIVRHLVKGGVMVSNSVHPIDLANLYHWSKTVYIPADIYGGGERAVMEAKACGCKVEIEPDNPKLQEILEGPILDEKHYAEQLKKGIFSVL